jgi:hypothetical protein
MGIWDACSFNFVVLILFDSVAGVDLSEIGGVGVGVGDATEGFSVTTANGGDGGITPESTLELFLLSGAGGSGIFLFSFFIFFILWIYKITNF